ncbi:MAG TPA: hypothetical protein PKO06_08380, partial [Candidatus Ozemobacteraceae bacterium]|nr:hypothetical protein [Candidatus Ozemobacteraceae bacterium]
MKHSYWLPLLLGIGMAITFIAVNQYEQRNKRKPSFFNPYRPMPPLTGGAARPVPSRSFPPPRHFPPPRSFPPQPATPPVPIVAPYPTHAIPVP